MSLNYALNVSLLFCHIVIFCSSKSKTQKACEILGNSFLTFFNDEVIYKENFQKLKTYAFICHSSLFFHHVGFLEEL